jgi:DNA recombination protein RmuC
VVWSPVYTTFLLGVVAGFVIGLAVAFALKRTQAKALKELADELFRESEAQRKASVDSVIENVKACFGSLSLDALSKSTAELLKLAQERLTAEREVGLRELEGKKGLIDQQLQQMSSALAEVSHLMKELEKDREKKFGELASQLRTTGDQTTALMQSTQMLREALVSTKARGQWGERMAEDVLRLAGFIEGINYWKQKTIEGARSRPDFTFPVPPDLKLHMDVKFPLDNYLRFLDANSEAERSGFRTAFLRDVRARIRELTAREYINPGGNTLDCVLLFIPNEQIYSFIHEQDSSILDEGIKNKVVFCSPITLFAVLAVIRQAADHFTLEQTSNEILSLLGAFKKQWDKFSKTLETMGKRIREAQGEYEALATTRSRQLEGPLNKIEDLRRERKLPVASGEWEDGSPALRGHEGDEDDR